jgi:fido (protein-threonine AMPylation protein)
MLNDTELRLSFWRDGSTNAERLAAAVLRLAGYEEIDPQSPLGGPDAKKDILCRKGGLDWIAAVYFPIGPKKLAVIKKKYLSDLSGTPKAENGFVFVTNQTLSPGQRKMLTDLANSAGREADILHLQQIQTLLDSPPGYGIRIQFLKIAMSIEEQLSWATDSDTQTAKALAAHTRELLALRALMERLNVGQSHILRTLGQQTVPGASTPDLISVSSFAKNDQFKDVSSITDPSHVILFHRLICFDLPTRAIGQLRSGDARLGNKDGQIAKHIQPPPASDVVQRLEELCDEWRFQYKGLKNEKQKLMAIAKFHCGFLLIHPFTDGNGRVARALLMQQCLDLFGKADMTLLNKGADYYSALQVADGGSYESLLELIKPVVRR